MQKIYKISSVTPDHPTLIPTANPTSGTVFIFCATYMQMLLDIIYDLAKDVSNTNDPMLDQTFHPTLLQSISPSYQTQHPSSLPTLTPSSEFGQLTNTQTSNTSQPTAERGKDPTAAGNTYTTTVQTMLRNSNWK